MAVIGGRGSVRGGGAVTFCPTLSRYRRVGPPTRAACAGGRPADVLGQAAGAFWEGEKTAELLGVFSTSVLSDDGRVLSPVGPPTTALFRALQSGRARIEVIRGIHAQGTPTTAAGRDCCRRLTEMIAFGNRRSDGG